MFSNDKDIIDGLMQGGTIKRKAEDTLFTRYMYFIEVGQTKYSLNEDDLFTAYSNTVLKTIDNIIIHAFEGRSSLKTYMHTIFHNNCVDLIRKNSSTKYSVNKAEPFTDVFNNLSDTAQSVMQVMIERTDMDLLKKNIQDLGNKCKELLELFLDGHPDAYAAKELSYSSADVVRTSRGRCIDKLRQLYTQTSNKNGK
jgi:DNA-directed RNA polymerase specialized sigma24 family protein